MGWGKIVTVIILGFVVFMSSLVYMALQQDFYLVTDSYYTDGLNYDAVQEKIENVKSLESKIQIEQTSNEIDIIIPTDVKGGTLDFYRPSNGTLDFSVAIENNSLSVDKSKILKGNWV